MSLSQLFNNLFCFYPETFFVVVDKFVQPLLFCVIQLDFSDRVDHRCAMSELCI